MVNYLMKSYALLLCGRATLQDGSLALAFTGTCNVHTHNNARLGNYKIMKTI